MNLEDLIQIQTGTEKVNGAEKSADEAIATLKVAVMYVGPDGTAKLCGNRCMFHIESGEYKNRCMLLGKNVEVPNLASCSEYMKGKPAEKWQKGLQPPIPQAIFTPEEVGLILGKVQCKRCIRSDGKGTCLFLTDILQKVMGFKGAVFKIDGDACCNANRSNGQEAVIG